MFGSVVRVRDSGSRWRDGAVDHQRAADVAAQVHRPARPRPAALMAPPRVTLPPIAARWRMRSCWRRRRLLPLMLIAGGAERRR